MIAKVNSSKFSKTYEYIGANYQSEREIFIEDIFQTGNLHIKQIPVKNMIISQYQIL